jgi:methyl-accepting chemotaxis protein
MELQLKSANEFTVTSATLNGQIFEMTDLVNKLSNDIMSGLKAVSESGRRMIALNVRYEKYAELVEKITETNQQVLSDNQHITSYLPKMVDSIPNLGNSMSKNLSESVEIQRNSTEIFSQLSGDIKDALKIISQSSDRLEALNSRYENYAELVEKITQSNQNLLAKLEQKSVA